MLVQACCGCSVVFGLRPQEGTGKPEQKPELTTTSVFRIPQARSLLSAVARLGRLREFGSPM